MRPLLPPLIVRRAFGLCAAVFLAFHVSWSQGAYYAAVDTGSATFVADLHALINPHTKLLYSTTTVADIAALDTTGGQKYLDCVYSGFRYVYAPPFAWTPTTPFSREHTWCHSWMPTYSSESGPEYSDLHHLFPTHQNNANGRRSNHPLGVVVNVTYQYLDGRLGTNAAGQEVYEPRNQQKGDAARALFYMATAYHGVNGKDWSFGYLNTVTLPALSEAPQDVDLLRQWHAQDPPDDWERARNESVYVRQENRNPFVDHPEYADVIDFVTMTKWSGSSPDTGSLGEEQPPAAGASPVGMALVVNEYYNTSTVGTVDEWVELLVLQDAVDLRGVKVRDHSTSGTPQTPFSFSTSSLWSSVVHGTIIVLLQPGSVVAEDLDAADKVIKVKTNNNTYFSPTGSFSIGASSDAIQLLTANSVHIHALGHGSAVNALPSPRAIAGGSVAAPGAVAFFGISDSTHFKSDSYASTSTTSTFGQANDAEEEAFLATLLPVQLISFRAEVDASSGVRLLWRTASEADNAGFEVERRGIGDERPPTSLGVGLSSVDYQRIAFVPGAGTSSSPREYRYDDAPAPGRTAYRLKQIDRDGTATYSGEVEVEVGSTPREFRLDPAFPNPFNPSTTLAFRLAETGPVTLRIFNLLGQPVATLVEGILAPGRMNRVTWNADGVPSGVYLARLESGGASEIQRLVLAR